MPSKYSLTIINDDGRPFAGTIAITFNNGRNPVKGEIEGALYLEGCVQSDIAVMGLISKSPGSWVYYIDDIPPDEGEIRLTTIKDRGPLGWWHAYHGITNANPHRGEKVTLGIVDLVLKEEPGVDHVFNYGVLDPNTSAPTFKPAPGTEFPKHGNVVTTLACGRLPEGSRGFQGIAPGVEAHFVAVEKNVDGVAIEKFDLSSISRAIRFLSLEKECDIITVSAGLVSKGLNTLYANILEAQEHGTTVIFAAGNDRGPGTDASLFSGVLS